MSENTTAVYTRLGQFLKTYLRFDFSSRIYLYSALVGVIAGLVVALFTYGLELAQFIFMEKLAGLTLAKPAGAVTFNFSFLGDPAASPHPWILVLLPAFGALIGGLLAYRWAPETAGPGTDAMIDAFHNQRGLIRPIVAPIKALATIFTVASGGSAGKEGPVTQIGAALGSWVATQLKLSTAQRRILLLAGTAGGVGAIFRAPLGGAITSVEVLYREDFESDALIPCVISSCTAYAVYMWFFGFSHIFAIPPFSFTDVRELFFYLVLGALCALAGILYVQMLKFFRERCFGRLPLPPYLLAALGGLLVGLMALIDMRILGGGFGVIQAGISGQLGLRILLLLALLKAVSSCCTTASGGSGGLFGPSLFIGGMLGGAVGLVGHHYFPDVVQQPTAYVVVGMASFFGAVANTPLAALIIVSEMSGSYELLPPLMLVSAFALIFARGFSIYRNQVQNKFHSPAHLKDFTIDVLQNLGVGEVFPHLHNTSEAVVYNQMPYFSLNALSKKLGHLHFVVLDAEDRLRGMIRLDDLDLPDDEFLKNLILIEDVLAESYEPIYEEDDLHGAMEKLLNGGFDKLPVLRREENGETFLGYMMYQDLLRIYNEEIEKLAQMD
jgi:CIC family chloride channel protein